MRPRLVGLGLIVLLSTASSARALDGRRGVAQYAHTRYETRDGLPHGLVNSIAQTADGYLWTGSEEGLARFDGARFTTFDHSETEGLPTNQLTALAVDPEGGLWVGTRDHGLVRRVDGAFHSVEWVAGASDQQIRALAFDRDGELWVGTRARGLVRLHAGKLVAVLGVADGLPTGDVRSLLLDRDGAMWIGTFRGLVRWQAGHLARGPAALDGVAIYGMAQDASGDLWCATEQGLAHLHGGGVTIVGADRLPAAQVRKVLFDRDGNLWIGTDRGAARRTPGGQLDMLARSAVAVLALFEDSEGNVWIGTEKGLDRLRDGDVVPVGASEGATDEAVFGIREDPAGALWFATNAGLLRIPPGHTTAETITAADRGTMYSIYADPGGDVWFGARDGSIGRWRDQRFTWLGRRDWERVRAIIGTDAGRWIGTNHGMFLMRGDRVEDAEPVLPGPIVSAITADARGALWIGTEGQGLLRWQAGVLVAPPAGGPPPTSSVTTIQFDPDGSLWAGTEGDGLWRLRDDRWFAFTAKDGMFDDLVWRILDDGFGRLWMSSNRGIWSVSRQELEERAAGARATVHAVRYGEADGMRDRECNGAVDPAGWRTRDGRLWFPTGKGLAVIDPAHLHPLPPPNALLESVRVDGVARGLALLLELAPGSNRLELAYTAPALRGSERLVFRYRLEGFDRAWNEAGEQRVAQYTNLAPGTYQFIIEAGTDGAWGRAATIEITLRPHIYQTAWFAVLMVVAIVLVIGAVPWIRVRRLRAGARELDRRVQEAIRELKVLSGLLPICAWCKKVRDDQGYWSKIEAYLSARTEARFTHGICPDCETQMIPDEDHDHGVKD